MFYIEISCVAGSVMYEHGMRLGREVPSRQGLQKQSHCYLAAMNALRLVNPMYAWIVKPTAGNEMQVRIHAQTTIWGKGEVDFGH